MRNDDQKNSGIWTAKEVSEYLRIPVSSLWHLTKTGKIRGKKIGKHWRYQEADIRAFFENPNESETTDDRRKHPRLNCRIPFSMKSESAFRSESSQTGVIQNLSEGGLYLAAAENESAQTDVSHSVGDSVRIEFALPEGSKNFITAYGRIVHRLRGGIFGLGVKFRQLSPEDREAIKSYVG